MASYEAAPIARLDGGLVLADQPGALDPSQAVDLLNVTFSERGGIRTRDGYAQLTTSELTNQPDSLAAYVTSGGTKRLVVGNGSRLDVLDTFPGASAANASTNAGPHSFARFGGPTAEVVYIANGTDQIRKLSGTTFTTPAGLSGETGRFVAVWQNRLVVAREGGTTAGNNPSSVRFSDPGDPENFAADVYEDLDPGDGEAIQGMATWRELLFVFKQSRFYVFDGIGVDAAGEADPDWRRVEAGVGLCAPRAVVAARDGVYFLDRTGVYRTTGGEPAQVSAAIDPLFVGETSMFFTSNTVNASAISSAAMTYHRERIYLAVPTGASSHNDRMLVFDPRYGWWSLYDIPAAAMCPFRPGADDELIFAYSGGGKHIGRHSPSYRVDDAASDGTEGSDIAAHWRSGWLDFGDPSVKTIRESKIWGEGAVDVRLTRDYLNVGSTAQVVFSSGAPDAWADGTDPDDTWGDGSGPDTWGPVRQITPRLVRQARRGTVFSIEFSGAAPWAIHRLAHHLRERRIPSTPRTEAP